MEDLREFECVDLFCGAGGTSEGTKHAIEELGGVMRLRAVNHWNRAIETHSLNHPEAMHVVEDVNMVNPESVVENGYLDILMASPECTFHSRARGGKPIHDQGRMSAWAIFNWLSKLDVRTVLIENVPEFVDWGPLGPDNRPIKELKGREFQAWFMTFLNLGYNAEWRMLNAADYGNATTRIRFFLIARKDGRPIEWPEPTHAKGDTGMFPGRLPWRGAKEIIDWTNPGRSLLDDPKYIRKPLSEKTRRRIARGLERFGGLLAPLYIRLLDIPDYPVDFSKLEGEGAFILNRHGENGSDRIHNPEDPSPTVTTRGAGYLVSPEAEPFILSGQDGGAPKLTDNPVPSFTGTSGIHFLQADAQPFTGANRNHNVPRSVDEPVMTPTTAPSGGLFLARPVIIKLNHGNGKRGNAGDGARTRDIEDPLSIISGVRGLTGGGNALVNPSLIEYYGTSYAREIEAPVSGITSRIKHALISPILIEYYGTINVSDTEDPLPTVTTKARHGLASPVLLQLKYGNGEREEKGDNHRVKDVDDPLWTVTGKNGMGLALPLLEEADWLKDVDPRRLVAIDGQVYVLDIKFRMLQNPELARAMGFDDDETQYEFVGTVAEVTKQIGNAVPVHLAAALVKSILKDS